MQSYEKSNEKPNLFELFLDEVRSENVPVFLGIKIHTIIFFFKIIVYLCSRKAAKTNEAARGNMLAWIENCV